MAALILFKPDMELLLLDKNSAECCLYLSNNISLAGDSMHMRVTFLGRDLFHSGDIKPLNKREFVIFRTKHKGCDLL